VGRIAPLFGVCSQPVELSEGESDSEGIAIPIQTKEQPKKRRKASIEDGSVVDEPGESLMVESEKEEEEDEDEDLEPDE
jgi:hypothetical protein